MTQSLLIFHFGQSNADCHDAGPAYAHTCLQDPRIVVPNDGFGFRGLAGRPKPRDITGFTPAHQYNPRTQSIGIAAAARYLIEAPDTPFSQVIVRSGGKGGRPLCGFEKRGRLVDGIYLDPKGDYSSIFNGTIADIQDIAAVSAEAGAPICNVMIPFFHGEADRNANRTAYATVLGTMMNDIEDALAKMGLPVTWLMTQPSGTSGGYAGNAWENRMSVLDICDSRPNAYFVNANYAYQLEDSAHLSARSKALVGELMGCQIAQVLAGKTQPAPRYRSAVMGIDWIDLCFDAPDGVTLDLTQFPAPHIPHGFEIIGRTDQHVTFVEAIDPHTIRVHTALPLCPDQGELRYAFSDNARRKHNDGSPFPFGRGTLRADWSAPSAIVDGQSLYRWVPGFALPLSEIAQSAVAA